MNATTLGKIGEETVAKMNGLPPMQDDDWDAPLETCIPVQDDTLAIPDVPDAPEPSADEMKLTELAGINSRRIQALLAVDRSAATLKTAKAELEEIEEELFACIGRDSSDLPLFDTPKVAKEGLPPPTPDDESWREIPLGEALPMLTDAVHKKLAEAGMKNMGNLADWTKVEYSPGRFQALSDIKGIGSGTALKIEDATMEFWRIRNAQAAMPVLDAAKGC